LFGTSQKRLTQMRSDTFDLFLTFIVVIVPFVMLTYFGAAIIIYDAITAAPWPIALPAKPSSRELLAVAVPYIGLTVWLWLRWRKL
jgi:hypothetical protein